MMVVIMKKQKSQKSVVCHKKELKFENYENCLEATQIDNKTKYQEKNRISIDGL